MSFKDIVRQDLADFHRLTALLIVGVSRERLFEEFPGASPVMGRSLWTYVNDLIVDGSVAETNGKLKYRYNPL